MTIADSMSELFVLDRRVLVHCADCRLSALLRQIYPEEPRPGADLATPSFEIRVGPGADGGFVVGAAGFRHRVEGLEAALWAVGDCLVRALQLVRAELLFLHAAALERHGEGLLLVAESGGGKSTTTWGLLHHGCRLLSDELAPVDERDRVHPFLRAIGLKREIDSHPVPVGSLRPGHGIHVPIDRLPTPHHPDPVRPRALFFIRYTAEREPRIEPIGAAEATTLLYRSALNPLAHPDQGLEPCSRLATGTSCFRVSTGELGRSCAMIVETFDRARVEA